jgi:2-haloalkanoic acid dehalogenase type II
VVADSEPLVRPHPSQIKAVAFDCYGTLLDFDERAFAPAVHAFLEEHGIAHVDGDDVWKWWLDAAREHSRAHGRDPEKPLDGPEPPFFPMAETWPRFFEHAFREAGIETPHPHDAFLHMFDLLANARPYQEVHEVLQALQRAAIPVVVASNADDVHLQPALERNGIEAAHVLSSEELRSYKPRRPFFDAVAARLGLKPHEILYVGDNPYADVTGARNAGMLAYWVCRYEHESHTELLKAEPHWTYSDLRGLVEVVLGEDS